MNGRCYSVHKKSKSSNQATLDNLPKMKPKDAVEIIKQRNEPITITQIEPQVKEDDLTLKIFFKLPSKKSFSRVRLELLFDDIILSPINIRLLQGPLATKEFEFSTFLDMKGVASGNHQITIKLWGLWDSQERLCQTQREISINYQPQERRPTLVKIPSIRKVIGGDIAIISPSDKKVYIDLEKNAKKESQSKKDKW